nr:hypothetical protein [Tanacetum cinerariifolium]
MPAARLTPDDNEARSDWWISTKAYFDGFIGQVERVPFDLSCQNMQEMNVHPDGQSSFQGHVNSSYFNMGTPSNFQTLMPSHPGSSDWQRQMPAQSPTQYWQPGISSQHSSYYSFGQVPSHMGSQICKPLLRRIMMLMAYLTRIFRIEEKRNSFLANSEGSEADDFNQAWMESSGDSDQEINANMVFMAQIEKVLSDSEASSSSADEKIYKISYYLSESESESEFETSEYYDNSTNYGLFVNNNDDQEIFHDAIESASENFIENHIDSQKDYNKSDKLRSESLKSKGFESSETVSSESENQSENDCHVAEKQCGNMESSKVIAPGMFKLNVSQCVSLISMSKSSYLDTFSSVRRPKNSGVIWKKKGSSNTSNVGETSSAYMCNDAMNVSCDSMMNDLLDDNNFFIFDDVNVRISPVSKMPFRKKPRDFMNVR